MARNKPRLDESMWPKKDLAYKPIPFENMDGEEIHKCPKCNGFGCSTTGVKFIRFGDEERPEKKTIHGNHEKSLKKQDYQSVSVVKCDFCKSTGIVR